VGAGEVFSGLLIEKDRPPPPYISAQLLAPLATAFLVSRNKLDIPNLTQFSGKVKALVVFWIMFWIDLGAW